MTIVNLDNIPVSTELTILSHSHILLSGIFSEPPLQTLQNFLPSRELEFPPSDGLYNVRFCSILSPHRKQDLPNVDTCSHANGFTIRMPHPTRQPICPCAAKHLVRPNDMEWVDTNPNMVPILTDSVGKVFVDGNAAGFQCFTGYLLLLVAHQVADEREEVHGGLLRTYVVDLDL